MNFILAECTRESFLNRFCETQSKVEIQPVPDIQTPEKQPLTETDKPDSKSENQNLVSGLFSTLENAPDLRVIAKCWPSVQHLRSLPKALCSIDLIAH